MFHDVTVSMTNSCDRNSLHVNWFGIGRVGHVNEQPMKKPRAQIGHLAETGAECRCRASFKSKRSFCRWDEYSRIVGKARINMKPQKHFHPPPPPPSSGTENIFTGVNAICTFHKLSRFARQSLTASVNLHRLRSSKADVIRFLPWSSESKISCRNTFCFWLATHVGHASR
jgi:hypothetical protein